MAPASHHRENLPVARSLDDFDRASGRWLERLVFNHRKAVLAVCALLTVVLGTFAIAKLTLNAGFDKMLPQGHPYIRNYLELRKDLRGLGNAVRVVVENRDGDIFDPRYLETLKRVSDELVLTPGVDRA